MTTIVMMMAPLTMMMTIITMHQELDVSTVQVGILGILIAFTGIRSGGAVVGDSQLLSLVGVIHIPMVVVLEGTVALIE